MTPNLKKGEKTMKKVKIYEVGFNKHPTEEWLKKVEGLNGYETCLKMTELSDSVLVLTKSREEAKRHVLWASEDRNYDIDCMSISYIIDRGFLTKPVEDEYEEWSELRVLGSKDTLNTSLECA